MGRFGPSSQLASVGKDGLDRVVFRGLTRVHHHHHHTMPGPPHWRCAATVQSNVSRVSTAPEGSHRICRDSASRGFGFRPTARAVIPGVRGPPTYHESPGHWRQAVYQNPSPPGVGPRPGPTCGRACRSCGAGRRVGGTPVQHPVPFSRDGTHRQEGREPAHATAPAADGRSWRSPGRPGA